LFESWSTRHPRSKENPNAAADAYLRDGRGFDLEKIKGWYTQENFWDSDKNIGSATVRFSLSKDVYWERLIDEAHRFGSQKANFRGKYRGMWWFTLGAPGTSPAEASDAAPGSKAPGQDPEIWITEGIFDAIALMHHGIKAASTLSCNNYPSHALAALAEQCAAANKPRPKLVWAFDSDTAGKSFAKKFTHQSTKDGWESSVALLPIGKGGKRMDWNDAHQLGKLEKEHLEEYRYLGSLLISETPLKKSLLIAQKKHLRSFYFDFDNRIYWAKINQDKEEKELKERLDKHAGDGENIIPEAMRKNALAAALEINEICNCLPEPLYYIKNEATDEAWYYFRVAFPHDGATVRNTFTSGQLSSGTEFKRRLLHIGAGAIWAGHGWQLDALLKDWTYQIKTVQTIDYIGYSSQHKTYIFNQVAVKAGKVYERNEEDYFEIGKLSIKSLSRLEKMDINTDFKSMDKYWFDRFYLCFGAKGIIALAYWLGTLFAEQIRASFESYPFLEIVGEPGAGKTTLIETLWKLLGRNGYEGFDPMKSSHVGFLRSMAQVSNLPVVLIESDREKDADGSRGRAPALFHWDSLKSLYNGGSLRTTGIKSAGNDTYDPQFRAALVISQNVPVAASPAIMERIIHLNFDKSHQSEAGREVAQTLSRMAATGVSAFLLKAIMAEDKILAVLEEHGREYERVIAEGGAKNLRIQKNYGQVVALISALRLVTPITQSQRIEASELLVKLARERELEFAREHPVVERFWEIFDYLNGIDDPADGNTANGNTADGNTADGNATNSNDFEGGFYRPKLNHSHHKDQIAVNLNQFIEIASERRQQPPDLSDLKKYLKTSKSRKFVAANVATNSAINARYNSLIDAHQTRKPTTVRCWLFKKEKS